MTSAGVQKIAATSDTIIVTARIGKKTNQLSVLRISGCVSRNRS